MKNHLIKITTALFLILTFHQQAYSQTKSEYKIAFKDYHSTDILDIQLSQDSKYILTSDNDGKVLMYDAKTFDFIKTVKPSGIIPVSGMQLVKNDSVLMMSQRYPTSYRPEFDTLLVKSMYADTIFNQQQLSVRFADLDINGHSGILTYDQDQGRYSYGVVNKDMEAVTATAFGYTDFPNIISVSHNFEKIAYRPNVMKKDIIVVNQSAENQRDTIPMPENEEVFSLFFDKNNHELFALTSIIEDGKQEVKIYNLSSGSFDIPIYTMDYWASNIDRVISKYDGERHIMAIVNGGVLGRQPLIITRDRLDFTHQLIDIPKGATNAVINTAQKEIIFVNQGGFKNIKDLSVYNYDTENVTGTFPEMTSNFYTSVFLPDDSWLALTGGYADDISRQEVKYFEAGTFNNRFGTFSFLDYLKLNHGVYPFYAKLIEKEGIAVVYGNGNYYIYDFPHDKLKQVTDVELNVNTLQDYNLAKNLLLLADGWYMNQGHTESIKLTLVKDNQITPIEGDYKFGRFSNNGNYLLTINKDNLLEIKNLEQLKTIYTKELAEGSYILHAIDESAFLVSNSFRYIDKDKCNRETDAFDIKEDSVTVTNMPCGIINDISYAHKNVGFILDNFGIVINDKGVPFTKSDFPKSISFNQDGSKFILSLNSGKNAIYDTEGLKPLGYMIHPDNKTHIFYDENNNYFSNINPEQFLYAVKDGNNVPLRQVENDFFNPEEILHLFGTPNQHYLTALQKALQLRKDNYISNEQVAYAPPKIPLVTEDSRMKPNLYLLSIGVSDYKDGSYSLTLSDKDAIDIARIYGNLNPEQIKAYYDKFFGTRHTLYNQDNEPLVTLNNYTGRLYDSFGYKYLLNAEGDIWIEDKYGEYTIWDYRRKSIDSLHLPTVERYGSLSGLNGLIFIKPDNTGFYLKGKEGFFEYLFETKQFDPVSLPFEASEDNFIPLHGNKWLHFDHQYNGQNNTLTITTGKFNSDKLDKSFILEFEGSEKIIRDIQPDGSITIDTIWTHHKMLKTASADGRYVFYTMSNQLFFLDLHQKEIVPTRLPIDIENTYNYKVSVDSDGKQFYSLETLYGSDEEQDESKGQRLTYYDFKGKKLKTLLSDINYGKDGVVNNGISYYYIKESEGLLSKNMFINTEETLEKTSPYTFDNVYTEYITNDNADSKTISEKLQTFFEKASPQDQVMVFLAGHGVLDSKNNYYFAPYDMDFEQVDKNGVSFETIVQSLQKSPAQNKLLLMDTCHSGKTIDLEEDTEGKSHKEHEEGDRGVRVVSKAAPRYKVSDVISTLFEDFLSNSGVTIISASSGGDLAQEHQNWGNGAFTSSFIKVLKTKMGGDFAAIRLDDEHTKHSVTLDDGFINALYKEVVELTNGKQTPDLRELNKKAKINLW